MKQGNWAVTEYWYISTTAPSSFDGRHSGVAFAQVGVGGQLAGGVAFEDDREAVQRRRRVNIP